MKVLRAHDYPAAPPAPNLKALQRIMAGFITAAAICLAITVALIVRDARPRKAQFIPVPASGISGAWKGTAALIGPGICDLKLEIAEHLGRFSGFSSFSCTQADPLMNKPHHPDLRTEVLCRLNPNAAVLTGAPDGTGIRFRSEKVIGADINGCSVSGFAVTRFGESQIAAEWRDCGGGAVIMQRQK